MYQRNGKWYSDFWYAGKRYTKGWGSISKSIAKEKERKFINDIASGEYESKKKRIVFDKLAKQYLEHSKTIKRPSSYKRDEGSIKRLSSFFSGQHLSEITPWLIEKYRKERLNEVQRATVNRERTCLSAMFAMAKKWGLAKENPVQGVARYKEEVKDVRPLTPDKEKELFDRLKNNPRSWHVWAIAFVALYAGMRKGEILKLTRENVDFKRQIIRVTHTKNWEAREIPMSEVLTKVLKEAIARSPKDSPYVFANSKTGKPYTDVKTSFTKATKKVGLEGFRFHDLRHTWCSRMCELGIAETAIQKAGGWKTRSMISRYSHPSMDYIREALEQLSKVPLIFPLGEEKQQPSNLTTPLTSFKI
jgi:integrase